MAGDRSIIRRIVSIFDKQSADKAQGEMVQSLAESGEKGGKKAGQNFLRDLRAEFNKRKAQLAEQLARGTIDQKEFRKQTDIAAKTFNDGLLKGIEEARRQGRLTDAEYTKLTRSIKRVGDEGHRHIGGRLVDALKKAAVAAAALFGIRQVTRFVRESIRAAEALQATQRGLEQQLRNVGVAWNDVEHEVRQHARALWDTHRLTHGEMMETLRELVMVTGNYEQSLRSVGLAHNIAAATGMSASNAARYLGRIMNGEITVLRRYGVTLDENRDALEQLEEHFDGAAKAGTTAGQALTKAWGDFKEEFGAALLGVAEGESVLDRATNAVRWMADNVDELLHTIRALTIAIAVMAGVKGLAGAAVAFRTATAAALTFRTALMGFWAMIGPKGWFVLGVVAVTEAIRRSGSAARQAARDMREWEDSLRSMSLEELYRELQAVTAQRRQVEAQLERFQASGQRRLAADAQRRLEIIRQGGFRIIAEINRLQNQVQAVAPGEPGDVPESIDREAEALDRLQARRDEILSQMEREIEVSNLRAAAILEGEAAVEALNRKLHIEEALLRSGAEAGTEFYEVIEQLAAAQYDAAAKVGLKEQQQALIGQQETLIEQMERELELSSLRAAATLEGEAAVEALNRKLHIQDALLRAGAEAGTEFADTIRELAAAQYDAARVAEDVQSAWVEALHAVEEEARLVGATIHRLISAWAVGGIEGLVRLAKAKVAENLARAAENFAKAWGWIGALNPAGAAAAKKAAVGHLGAAAKWGAAGGVAAAMGGGGGGGSMATGSVPSMTQAGRTEPAGPEVHIYFDGPGFDAVNPTVQRVLAGAAQIYGERYGPNAKVQTHRRR